MIQLTHNSKLEKFMFSFNVFLSGRNDIDMDLHEIFSVGLLDEMYFMKHLRVPGVFQNSLYKTFAWDTVKNGIY